MEKYPSESVTEPQPADLCNRLTEALTEAEAVIMRAQDALGVDHGVWWILDDYDGSMDSVKALIATAEARGRKQGRQEQHETDLAMLRDDARFHAWRYPTPAPWQHRPLSHEPNHLAADFLESTGGPE